MVEAMATATEVKNRFGKYLKMVINGNEVIVTQNGQGGICLEHKPLAEFNDGLVITYSDIKEKGNGSQYITIYFERPNDNKSGFDSASMDYPGTSFRDVKGFTGADLRSLRAHVRKLGPAAYSFSKEDAHA